MLDILSDIFNVDCQDVLSENHRGAVISAVHRNTKEKLVFRLSDANHQSSPSIREFGLTFADFPENVGLVPMHKPQWLDVGDQSYLCEIYNHIIFEDGKSMDLHEYVAKGRQHKSMRTAIGYLHDVVGAIAKLHKAGFCHMDISLENVVLSQNKAYVIDFESNIKHSGQQYIMKQDISVPVKLLYCPIEHFKSKKTGFVDIETYDVWAFGVMLFVTLFGEFLFRTVRAKFPGGRPRLQVDELRFFYMNGLDKYVEKYRPRAAARLAKHSDDEVVMLAWDLLQKIFVSADKIRSPDGAVVLWDARQRVRAEDVLSHPLWNVVSS